MTGSPVRWDAAPPALEAPVAQPPAAHAHWDAPPPRLDRSWRPSPDGTEPPSVAGAPGATAAQPPPPATRIHDVVGVRLRRFSRAPKR
jgi:hypothetical protein